MDVTSDLDGRLLGCFQVVFPDLPDEALVALRYEDSEEWDSLASLNLLTVVEEEFEVMFDDAVVPTLDSFAAVRRALAEPG